MTDHDQPLHLTDAEIARAFSESKWAEKYPPVLTVDEAAQLVGVPKATLYNWSSRGLLRGCSRKVGRHLRIGVRVGEAKWLTWDDVDFEHRLIHIRPKEGWKPKSGDERAVPMSDRLFDLLHALPHTGTWVFTARVTTRHPATGRQVSERRLLQYLKRLLKRLGLKGHLHTFRHSFISFAANSGVPERVLRK